MSFQDVQGSGRPSASRAQSPSQAVAAGIFQINTAVAGLRRLVDSIGTSKDTPDHRQKLHDTRQRILELVKDTSAKLNSLRELDHELNGNPGKKIEDAKLAKDFQATLQEFQKVQQLAAERESIYAPSGPSPSTKASLADKQGETPGDPEYRPFLREQERQQFALLDNEIAFNEAMIEEREQGIREVEAHIGQANEIFRDLVVLVHEQGVIVDDISSNIESSSAKTKQATVQLAKASKSVKSRFSWCWWVLGIVVLAVIVFLIVLIFDKRTQHTAYSSG